MKATFHQGELKRYSVPVRCVSHRNIWTCEDGSKTSGPIDVLVFATNKSGAQVAAIEKMVDKYLRHQNKHTEWIVTGQPKEC
jgi:hypothetical protein